MLRVAFFHTYTPMQIPHIYKPSAGAEALFYTWFTAMHTRVDIAIHGPHTEASLVSLAGDIARELQRLEALGNFFDPASELSVVNRLAGIQPVGISRELYGMLQLCKEAHQRTLGCFDISVCSEPHTPHTLHEVHLSETDATVRFGQAGTRLTLSGFLKGYALDSIKRLLTSAGIENALVNVGNSSILGMGASIQGGGWQPATGISLHNQCLTTSGNDTAGRTHIVCPQTGVAVAGVRQVSVVTESGAWGEICSTALFASPEELREPLLDALDEYIISYR